MGALIDGENELRPFRMSRLDREGCTDFGGPTAQRLQSHPGDDGVDRGAADAVVHDTDPPASRSTATSTSVACACLIAWVMPSAMAR